MRTDLSASADRPVVLNAFLRVTAAGNSPHNHTFTAMRLFNSICVLLWTLFAIVQAKSATGDRVLVVLEDADEKPNYSQLWADLECEKDTPWRLMVLEGR